MIRPSAAPQWLAYRRIFSGTGLLCLLPIVMLIGVRNASGQVFQTQAGASSLYQASGGTFLMRARHHEVRLAAGTVHGEFRLGTLLRRRLHGYTFGFGDEAVDLSLPTDLSSGTRYIPARGASLSFQRGDTRVLALAGTTSESFGAPYFQVAKWGRPVGLLFLDQPLGRSVSAFSRTLFAERNTFIGGITWKAHASLQVNAAAGTAAGSRYTASSITLHRSWLRVHGGYADTPREFRNVRLDSQSTADVVRENAEVTLKPGPTWSLHAARRHLIQPQRGEQPEARVGVNHLAGTLNVATLRLGGAVYETRGGRIDSVGTSLNIGRSFGDRTDVTVNYFGSRTGDGLLSNSVVATLREAINSRLSVAGFATRTDGQTTLKVGGEFLSNLLTVSVDYQTVYVPFRLAGPFVHGLGVNAIVQPFGSLRLQLGTVVTPAGEVRYTVSAGHSFHRSTSASVRSTGFRLAKYVVRGRVIDEAGTAVAGAVLRLNGEIVLTDDEGRFFARSKKARPLALVVVTAEFRGPALFSVVSAPPQLVPSTDDKANEISIVVSRRTPPLE